LPLGIVLVRSQAKVTYSFSLVLGHAPRALVQTKAELYLRNDVSAIRSGPQPAYPCIAPARARRSGHFSVIFFSLADRTQTPTQQQTAPETGDFESFDERRREAGSEE
jgi:hypothetical protein